MKSIFLKSIFLALATSQLLAADPGSVPADSKVINIRDLGAKGDGSTDDTAAIQEAFNRFSGSGSVIFLPNGTYLVSKTISWAGAKNRNVLQGESEKGAIIKLADKAEAFQDPQNPRPIFHTGGAPAQRFQNGFRTLTVDTGLGNPGAVGINFCANNTGAIRNVTIRSGPDGKAPGLSGLDLTESEVGPLLVKNLTVKGYDFGIRVKHSLNSVTLENIHLSGQRSAGIDNYENMVYVRNLHSENSVPAILSDGDAAIVTLINSKLTGGSPEHAAIENRKPNAVLFARNVTTAGYGSAIRDASLGEVPGGTLTEWCSDAPLGLFPGELKTLNLPVEETPEVAWEPVEKWVNVAKFGAIPGDGKDDTAAIQQAIDSGATTIYLPHGRELPTSQRPNNPGWEGTYVISDTIRIRNKVQRIIGLDASLTLGNKLGDKPVFLFENGSAPVVVIQQISFALGVHINSPAVVHQADRDLVISSFAGLNNLIHRGKGRLFLDDVVGNSLRIEPGARLWASQFNLEGDGMKLINNGGQVWIHGLKTEARGPILQTLNGGKTEIIGAHLYTCVDGSQDKGAFFVEDSAFSLVGGGEYVWSRDWATRELLQEKRGNEIRTLHMDSIKRRNHGSMMPYLISQPAAAPAGSPPAAPQAATADITATTVTLELAKPAGEIVGHRIEQNGALLATTNHARWQHAGLKPETSHQYQVIAYDRHNRHSKPTTLNLKTLPDTTPPTAPSDIRTNLVIDIRAELEWKPSQDDLGVKSYEITRLLGEKTDATATSDSHRFTDTTVKAGAEYIYQIIAIDAAGNRSEPGTLNVSIPKDPPRETMLNLAMHSKKRGDGFNNKGYYTGDLHPGQWACYEGIELGRTQAFTKATLDYACDTGRGGGELELILNPEITTDADGEPAYTGGTSLGRFTLADTGGWEKFQKISIDIPGASPGKHKLILRIHLAESKVHNALINARALIFSQD